MTLHTEYTVDEYGGRWVDDSGLYTEESKRCFMCQKPTHRLDVSYHAWFCNSAECNQAIEDEIIAEMDEPTADEKF